VELDWILLDGSGFKSFAQKIVTFNPGNRFVNLRPIPLWPKPNFPIKSVKDKIWGWGARIRTLIPPLQPLIVNGLLVGISLGQGSDKHYLS
jgi:hypothetical protein